MERNLKSVKLGSNAYIEDLDFQCPRGLDRALMLSLADAQWVSAHQSILVVGATGVGKTLVAWRSPRPPTRPSSTLPARAVPAK